MDYQAKMDQWLSSSYFDADTKKEISQITDEKELKHRFETDLEFGTGGLRGVMGAGTNRMNQYTVRRATYGLVLYLKETFGIDTENNGVVIAYDSRNRSEEFALQTALVFCACNIKIYIFDQICTTPELSFAVRYLNCSAGVVITASHNPKEYNGYKAYDRFGCQFVPKDADEIIKKVNSISDFVSIPYIDKTMAESKGLLHYVGAEIHQQFYSAVLKQSLLSDQQAKENLSIVYTPLHGTGNIPVREVLKRDGFNQVHILKEQEIADGNFPTVKSPNPENREALELALQLAKKIKADIVIGTDPDCDRVGIAVADDNGYQFLSGNQVGALLMHYILSTKKNLNNLTNKNIVIKTIVTSEFGRRIAEDFGVPIKDTLTGFKYIGELITEYEKNAEYDFLFGYEESYGYLIGKHARDKDAIVTSMMICEMAAYHKSEGKTLVEILQSLYAKYGYFVDDLDNFSFNALDGNEKIFKIMNNFRQHASEIFPFEFNKKDYSSGIDDLPQSDVLKFILQDGSWIAVRPSGTEPRMKFYYSIRGENQTEADNRLLEIKKSVEKIINLQ